MLLAIDVGNTHTVFGLYEGDTLRHHWRLETDRGRTIDEYGVLVRTLLAGVANPAIDGIVLSSVVPPTTQVVDGWCRTYLGVAPLILGQGAGAEMRRTLGTTVFSGMLGVTVFGLLFTPVFYVLVRWIASLRRAPSS